MNTKCQKTEDGEHEWELDYTDHVYGTYRDVKVEDDGVIVVDTCSNKTWDADTELHKLECQHCGKVILPEYLDIEWE